MRRKKWLASVTVLVIVMVIVASWIMLRNPEINKAQVYGNNGKQVGVYEETNSILYRNTQYGFSFSLPESLIITDKWEGGPRGGETVETGPKISIRHPQWTSQNPRQDIPIMIFTLTQWNALQQGEFLVNPAPIGPSELGRNTRYVFALPAHYNYAFPTGYEEVAKILESNPLQANENFLFNPLSLEEIVEKQVPKPFNPKVHSNSLEFPGRWAGNVMPGFIQEMKRMGWVELEDE